MSQTWKEVLVCYFAKYTSEISNNAQVPAIFKVFDCKWWQRAMHPSSIHIVPQYEVAAGSSMIRGWRASGDH